jgi:hypothetical protein
MLRAFFGFGIVGAMMLAAPGVARAALDRGDFFGNERHERAPEPVTALALAAGVGGLAAAGWRRARKSSRK